MTLTIRKTLEGEFEHIKEDGTILDGNPNATSIGNNVNFKTRNGSAIALSIPVSGINVIDVSSASNDTFANATALFIRLRSLGYFNQGEGAIIGNNTFSGLSDTSVTLPAVGQIPVYRDVGGSIVLVNEIPSSAFGVSSFNGFTGDVNADSDLIPEGTVNLYFTDSRVSLNPDVVLNSAHRVDQNNPHNVNANQLGLGNVDNTSDLNKPISNAQETRFTSIENKIAIVTNGNFPTVANVAADTALQTIISDNPGKPIAVFNEDGAIYTYDHTNTSWRKNLGQEVVYDSNVNNFPTIGNTDITYIVRATGGTPAQYYNWDGSSYVLSNSPQSSNDGNYTPFIRANAIENIEPTLVEVPVPQNGDTAGVLLNDGKLEMWLYTVAWNKAYSIDHAASVSAGVGITDNLGVFSAGGTVNTAEGVAFDLQGTGLFSITDVQGSGLFYQNFNMLVEGANNTWLRSGSLNTYISAGTQVHLGGDDSFPTGSTMTISNTDLLFKAQYVGDPIPMRIQPQNDLPTGQQGYVMTKIANDGTVGWQAPSSGATSAAFTPVIQSADLAYTFIINQGYSVISGGMCHVFIRFSGLSTTVTGGPSANPETSITGLPVAANTGLPLYSTQGEVSIRGSDNIIAGVKATVPPGGNFISFYNPLNGNENGTEFPFSGGVGDVFINVSYPI